MKTPENSTPTASIAACQMPGADTGLPGELRLAVVVAAEGPLAADATQDRAARPRCRSPSR